jgi:uncharacterized protein YjbI with pentapeptide repeats
MEFMLKSLQLTQNDIIKKVSQGIRSFQHMFFVKGRYCKLNLDGINFFGSNFREAFLDYCSFVKADLEMVHCNGVDARNVNFLKAKMDRARMWMASLIGCNFQEAMMRYVWAIEANFRGSSFSNADLSGSNLAGADFSDADLTGTNLSNTDLTSVRFTGARLCGTILNGAQLFGADFRGIAELSDIKIDGKTAYLKSRWDHGMEDYLAAQLSPNHA